jgi:hypothetical protein
MSASTRRIVGYVIAGVGIVIALVGLFADQLGLGGDGENRFGDKQWAALIAGIVILVIGLVVTFWPARKKVTEPV